MDELQASARDQARFYRKLTQLERREAKHQTEITANQIANLINQHSTNLQHNQGYQTGPTESQDWFNLSKRFYLTDRRNENLYRVTIEPIT